MNYYEHHIGDYDEATSHLTACEDGIYSRLIRKYYSTEKPLPNDIPAIQRLVRARTREEKNAVVAVLEEFFVLEDDGWHQKRCDADLSKFLANEPERELKKVNEDNRLKRHREERSRLFKALTDAGLHAPWNISMGELRDMVSKLSATAPETRLQPLPETAPATPATATQTPDTTTHTPDIPTTTPDGVVVDSPAADLFLAHSIEKPAKPGRPDCPHQQIIALYHELLPTCPTVVDWGPARAQALRTRWNEDPKRQSLAYWRKFFAYVGQSAFLTGRAEGRDGRKPFVADLEWMLKASNFTKIREGKYHEGEAA